MNDPEIPGADGTETTEQDTGAAVSLDALLDAALSEKALAALADKQIAEQLQKAISTVTRQATARLFTQQQAESLRARAQAAVFDRFGFSPDDPENEPEEEEVTPEEFTAAFMTWMGWLIPLIESGETQSQDFTWCPQWWMHSEAVDRLRALWLAHQQAYASDDRRGPSSWWVDHWDRHAPILLSRRGPFRHCSTGEHNATETVEARLPYVDPDAAFVIAVC